MALKCLDRLHTQNYCRIIELSSLLRPLNRPSSYHLRLHNTSRPRVTSARSSKHCFYRSFSAATIQHEKTSAIAGQISRTENDVLNQILGEAARLLTSTTPPSEADILNVLRTCENLAQSLGEAIEPSGAHAQPHTTPTLDLLSLEVDAGQTSRAKSLPLAIQNNIVDQISNTAYKLVTDPKIFVTPKILATYISTQTILGRPHSFPQVFDLYASKPIPQADSSPIKYAESNPNSPNTAIPPTLALDALKAAIEVRDLPLCLNIITTTVATSAYRRAKVIRKALLPMTAIALAPPAAYILSASLAQLQDRVDLQVATTVGTIGILAYLGFTSTIGYVAITTANDQMDRITWAMGTPLKDRWLREEERAFIDIVAGAWGFENPEKKGEEEGEDWEQLREWVMRRGMILDNPALMEGME